MLVEMQILLANIILYWLRSSIQEKNRNQLQAVTARTNYINANLQHPKKELQKI